MTKQEKNQNSRIFFSQNLKFLRQRTKATQSDVARILGVKPNTISNYEKGISHPSLDQLGVLVKIFDVSMDDLVYTDLSRNVHLISKDENNDDVHLNVHPNVHLNDVNSDANISNRASEEDIYYGGRRVTGGQDHHLVINIQDNECLIIYKVSGLIVKEHRSLNGEGSLSDRMDLLEARIMEIKRLLNAE